MLVIKEERENTVIPTIEIEKKLFPAMLISFGKPHEAIMLASQKQADGEKLKSLSKFLGLNYENGELLDKKGKSLNQDYILTSIANDISLSLLNLETLENTDQAYSLASMIEEVAKTLLTKLNTQKIEIPTVLDIDALKAKLYGEKEEVKTK